MEDGITPSLLLARKPPVRSSSRRESYPASTSVLIGVVKRRIQWGKSLGSFITATREAGPCGLRRHFGPFASKSERNREREREGGEAGERGTLQSTGESKPNWNNKHFLKRLRSEREFPLGKPVSASSQPTKPSHVAGGRGGCRLPGRSINLR